VSIGARTSLEFFCLEKRQMGERSSQGLNADNSHNVTNWWHFPVFHIGYHLSITEHPVKMANVKLSRKGKQFLTPHLHGEVPATGHGGSCIMLGRKQTSSRKKKPLWLA